MDLEGFGFAKQDDDDDLGSERSVLGFAELELKEAQKASRGLLDLYDKLFNHEKISAAQEKTPTLPADSATSVGIRRYAEGVGYDANYETLDVKELKQWRTNFSYINVTGRRLPVLPPLAPLRGTVEEMLLHGGTNKNTLQISAENTGDYWDSMTEIQVNRSSRIRDVREGEEEEEELCIVGVACWPKRICMEKGNCNHGSITMVSDRKEQDTNRIMDEVDGNNAEVSIGGGGREGEEVEEEEIFAMDGCLEEVFEIDRVNPSMLLVSPAAANTVMETIEPGTVHRDEIVSSLLDVLWSDIAVAAAPLIEQVASLADSLPDITVAAAAVPQEQGQFAFYDDGTGEMMRSGSEKSFGGW